MASTRAPDAAAAAPAPRVLLLGAGKLGRTLDGALGAAGVPCTLVPLRGEWPAGRWPADIVWLTVRDGQLADVAARAAAHLADGAVLLHASGALGPEALAAARTAAAGLGQAHPMLSFADAGPPESLVGGFLLVTGDDVAVQAAAALGMRLGLRPARLEGLNRAGYHAAGALLANGAAALADAASTLLRAAGVPAAAVGAVLGPLLASVAQNLGTLGAPALLTGPVRRGDVATVGRHLEWLGREAPELGPLFRELLRRQLTMARALAEAPPEALAALAAALDAPRRDASAAPDSDAAPDPEAAPDADFAPDPEAPPDLDGREARRSRGC